MSVDMSNQRPRSRTVLSFNSNRSGGSGGHKFTKEELVETPREKAAKRMSTKANPNIALAEVEPVVQALLAPTMDSNLRGMQHRDMFGNIITDPDRSNPTRPRLERPLDTIRSFEAAIDGKYGRVGSYNETPGPSRPASSYFGGMNAPLPRNRSSSGMNGYGPQNGGGYRSGRPESYVDSSMYGSANRRSPAPFGGPQRRGFGPRNNSDPALYGNNATYGQQQAPKREAYQQSYDSVGSSGGSGGTDNWQPSTDPSSPNSSVDRFQPQPLPKQQDLGEQYGFNGFGGVPQTDFEYQQQQNYQDQGYQNGYTNGQYQSQNPHNPYGSRDAPPPPPPAHKPQSARYGPSQSGSLQKAPSYSQQPQQQERPDVGGKRKSWLMRRFSKD